MIPRGAPIPRSGGLRRVRLSVGAVVALVAVGACARMGSPTGGADDRRPPVVIRVEPDTFTVVEAGLREFRVEFNERISEQPQAGTLDDVVTVAPDVGAIRVRHRRMGLEVTLERGLRPGVAYTIRVLPSVRDMFGNAMAGPFEWAVSTGGAFNANAVVGTIWDRASGDPVEGARVILVPSEPEARGDTLRYVAETDREGLYALRILPEGDFRVLTFQDRNRNDSVDFIEASGEGQGTLGPADTLFLSLPVLSGDSTAAVLAQLEVVDSQVVRLLFDDLLDPTAPVGDLGVRLVRDTLPQDTAAAAATDPGVPPADTVVVVPGVARRFHEWAWAAFRDSVIAEADSLFDERLDRLVEVGDTVQADSLRRLGRPALAGEDDRGYQGEGFGRFSERFPDGSPAPTGSLVLLLDGALPADVPVRVVVDGVVNLHGLLAGGGEASGTWVLPVDSSVVADSTAVDGQAPVPDTAGRGRW